MAGRGVLVLWVDGEDKESLEVDQDNAVDRLALGAYNNMGDAATYCNGTRYIDDFEFIFGQTIGGGIDYGDGTLVYAQLRRDGHDSATGNAYLGHVWYSEDEGGTWTKSFDLDGAGGRPNGFIAWIKYLDSRWWIFTLDSDYGSPPTIDWVISEITSLSGGTVTERGRLTAGSHEYYYCKPSNIVDESNKVLLSIQLRDYDTNISTVYFDRFLLDSPYGFDGTVTIISKHTGNDEDAPYGESLLYQSGGNLIVVMRQETDGAWRPITGFYTKSSSGDDGSTWSSTEYISDVYKDMWDRTGWVDMEEGGGYFWVAGRQNFPYTTAGLQASKNRAAFVMQCDTDWNPINEIWWNCFNEGGNGQVIVTNIYSYLAISRGIGWITKLQALTNPLIGIICFQDPGIL
jgi:hypothetical protein